MGASDNWEQATIGLGVIDNWEQAAWDQANI